MINKNDDTELVTRLHNNDVTAFDILYLKYHRALYANIFKLSRDEDATKDLLQEVFITLWEKRLTINANQPVANWLFTVSYNKTINFVKKELKESSILKALNEEIRTDDENKIGLRESQLQLIEMAVEQLSPQKKKVFYLCKIQGKTYDETALELNISKYTVKEYLSIAVINIKDFVEQHTKSYNALLCTALLSGII